jgi:hypothetical protein
MPCAFSGFDNQPCKTRIHRRLTWIEAIGGARGVPCAGATVAAREQPALPMPARTTASRSSRGYTLPFSLPSLAEVLTADHVIMHFPRRPRTRH